MGYDNERVYSECGDRDSRPIIPLRDTPAVKAGEAGPPVCEHGEWRSAGADTRRGRTKWRCSTGKCSPASQWIKADRLHPLVPRETKRWKALYRGRAAVEREFGRLKDEWSLLPLRVRGIERVRLHADLTILRSSPALSVERAPPPSRPKARLIAGHRRSPCPIGRFDPPGGGHPPVRAEPSPGQPAPAGVGREWSGPWRPLR